MPNALVVQEYLYFGKCQQQKKDYYLCEQDLSSVKL